MILILILALVAVLATLFLVAVGSVAGVTGIIIFGDVIVCIGFVIWLIKKLIDN